MGGWVGVCAGVRDMNGKQVGVRGELYLNCRRVGSIRFKGWVGGRECGVGSESI